jgi:23S rRNA-/tRNA-specific pseudouridylate synthase
MVAPGGVPPVISDWAKKRHGTLWTVHCLDLETSGVLLFARSEESHRLASRWFAGHEVRKTYECLAAGSPQAPVFRVQSPIEGSHCVTQVEVRERFPDVFLGRVSPLTGRRQQIRIHLSSEGFPLLGDVRYGGKSCVPRVALHALRLELPSRERFEAPWPADFEGWVGALRSGGSLG